MERMTGLPEGVERELQVFLKAAQEAWGEDLIAAVLFGSAAEGRLRAQSDVNLLLVLKRFTREEADRMRDAYRAARAAIRLGVMFALETELPDLVSAFAAKFDDIMSRHRVLLGADPFAGLEVGRSEVIARLRQVLLNLRLRLRERYALVSLREEQLARVVSDTAGPLRSSAATILKLEGAPAESPKAALARIVEDLGEARFTEALRLVSEARESSRLAPGAAPALLFDLMDLTNRLLARVERLG